MKLDDDKQELLPVAFKMKNFKWLLPYLHEHSLIITLAVFLILSSSLLAAFIPWISKTIIDKSIIPGDSTKLAVLVFAFFAIHLASFLIKLLQNMMMNILGQKIMSKIRINIFSHIMHLPKKYFDLTPTGKIMTRITSDVEALNEFFTSGLVVVFGDLILLCGIIVFIFYINWQLAFFLLAVFPVLLIALRFFRKRITLMYRKERILVAKLNTFLQENISGMQIVQLFSRQKKALQEFEEINEATKNTNIKLQKTFATFFPFVNFLSIVSKAIIVWYASKDALLGKMTVGEIVAFLTYLEMFYGPIRNLSEKYEIFQAAFAALEKISLVLSEPLSTEYQIANERILHGEIEFENVWFAYTGENWVLKNVSFKINSKTTIAIVGHTGSGKTTIINLLGRFYEVQKGRILIDGINILDWDIAGLRRQMGFVLQDVFLFNSTVAHNLSLLDANITEPTMQELFKLLEVDAFIANLPAQLNTPVHELGKSLSVGQRQILSFARTLLRNPSLLILDEATANIDTETEIGIEKATKLATANRTTIAIAHRLSTIRLANNILVIHKGELREQGSHEELIKKHGIYRTLYDLQYREQEYNN